MNPVWAAVLGFGAGVVSTFVAAVWWLIRMSRDV